MKLLADIGGTHARFALADDDGRIGPPQKYCVKDFETIEDALSLFCTNSGCDVQPPLLMAVAARKWDDGTYRSGNHHNHWIIDKDTMTANGWHIEVIANDFVASARGTLVLPDDQKQVLRKGEDNPDAPCVILGSGTGLGLAYMHPLHEGRWHIQQTAGAHMLAASVTEEQHMIIKLVARLKNNDTLVSYEDLASGRGLPVLYRAVCLYSGKPAQEDWAAADILDNADDPCAEATLRLFHEFLGLFTHNVMITGYCCGGLYLDGGVMHRLREKGLFDFNTFEHYMMLNPIEVLKIAMEKVPVTMVKDPFVALRGVLELQKDDLDGGNRYGW